MNPSDANLTNTNGQGANAFAITNTPNTLGANDINSNTGNLQTPVVPKDSLPGLVSSTVTPIATQLAEQAKLTATAQGNQSTAFSDLLASLNEAGGQTTDTINKSNELGLPGMNSELAQLQALQTQQTGQYLSGLNTIGSKAISMEGRSIGEASLQRQYGIDSLLTSSLIQAKQGNIAAATATVNNAINAKYAPILNRIEVQKTILEQANTKVATERAAQLSLQQIQTNASINTQTEAIKNLNDLMGKGVIDTNTGYQAASDLLSGKSTLADFYRTIGQTVPQSSVNTTNPVVQTTMQLMGAIKDMKVVDALTTLGKDKIVEALIGQEGGSPKGVKNNPGNIKFANLPGQVDSGVKATDGGTFANYTSPKEGKDAVGQLVQNAADGGKNLTDFIARYKGVSNTPTFEQYGLLSQTNFNPGNNLDKAAKTYLDQYIKNGTFPTAYTIFGKTSGNPYMLSAVAERAQQLFFDATGTSLPDVQILKGNKSLIVGNNKLLNNLNIQEGTINSNFKLAIDNIDNAKINQSSQPINAFLDNIKNWAGDADVATYLTQNGTIKNEIGSLLALKNASGTTVADKLESAGLVPKNASEKQQKAILKVLMQEAENGRGAISQTSSDLYKSIDPLQTDPNNPNRQANKPVSEKFPDIKVGTIIERPVGSGKYYKVGEGGNSIPYTE